MTMTQLSSAAMLPVASDASEVLPGAGYCRFCDAPLNRVMVDLGMSPLCESFLRADQINGRENFYPLLVRVCDQCWLVQLQAYVGGEDIFSEYAYFSSYSSSWLEHGRRYTEQVIDRFGLDASSLVIEVASNDGYLLRHFLERKVPSLGIEPAANVAAAAVELGVPTRVEFFGRRLAHRLVAEGRQADLLIGNNVLAQVPDLNDFVRSLATVLKPEGVLTLEFPHLLRLMAENQFDTIYHEHYSYFSFITAEAILAAHGIRVFDVEELPTHGGSLRLYGCLRGAAHETTERIGELRDRELAEGMTTPGFYESFEGQVREVKGKLLEFLIAARREGKRVVGYGAPGKGNTLLNYCGIRTDFVDFTVDRNPYKHGRFTPGTHIPIRSPEALAEARPDYVLILPWNLKDEIMTQLAFIRGWGGQFVVPIPEPVVYS